MNLFHCLVFLSVACVIAQAESDPREDVERAIRGYRWKDRNARTPYFPKRCESDGRPSIGNGIHGHYGSGDKVNHGSHGSHGSHGNHGNHDHHGSVGHDKYDGQHGNNGYYGFNGYDYPLPLYLGGAPLYNGVPVEHWYGNGYNSGHSGYRRKE